MPCHPLRAATIVPVLALVLLAVAADGTQAQTRDVKLSGMGTRKCSEWQHWKESRNTEARAMVLEWAQGFISGHNVYARAGTETANPVIANASVLIPLLDSYCQKKPEDRILSGVAEITQSLGGAKINLSPKTPPAQNPRPEAKDKLDS
ncbi:MAG: hypothetical protein FD157_1406 [Rhodocyclaceae bacterium]|nr:MAG: hypothetical protein FD157_1406 [Rhodocyclaceae bacterium]TND05627.1 MAG: hypothetical protein FD118_325 [Rhodocyclaceae bacterium]